MSILNFVLILTIIAVIIYAIRLAFAADWKSLIWLAVGLIIATIVLQLFGVTIPDIPRIK